MASKQSPSSSDPSEHRIEDSADREDDDESNSADKEDGESNSAESSNANDETETDGVSSSSNINQSASSEAVLNQLLSTVASATASENALGPTAQAANAATIGHGTTQSSFAQQLAMLSAANSISSGAGLPMWSSAGLAPQNYNATANSAMQAAAHLLSATANTLAQDPEQQQQLQSIFLNQAATSGNNLMANLLAANATAPSLQHHALMLAASGNSNLGQLQGAVPNIASLAPLVQGVLPTTAVAAAAPLPAAPPEQTESIHMTHRRPVTLDMDYDTHVLNDYQSLLRQQIELFETGPEDVGGKAQGRNKPVILGQVGIRCRHCAVMPKSVRPKGSVYYSRSLVGIYQIAQNMAKVHFGERKCRMIPEATNNRLLELQMVTRKASGGKDYWVHCLEILGVYEDGEILRFKPAGQTQAPSR